jgi:uncharacterized tellurite resistance protein B-like protein
MGFLKDNRKTSAENIYEKQVKQNVADKDGKLHVLMINSFSKFINQNFGVEDKYTTQIDSIVTALQDDGYEIVDIKFGSLKGQGIGGSMEGFHTLIQYK